MASVQYRGVFCPGGGSVGASCVLGMLLLVSSGCMVGPNFLRPSATVPERYAGVAPAGAAAEGASVATSAPPVELVQWWKTFKDPLLTSLVERAIGSNFDVQLAEARIRQARANRGVAAAALWPQVDVSGGYARSGGGSRFSSSSSSGTSSSGISGGGGGDRNLFQAGLDATWELDFFGGVRRNVEAADADILAAVEDRRDVLVTLVSEVGNNYLGLRGAQRQIAIAKGNLATQQHTAEITRKRFEAGYVSALDVANANAQVATTQSQIPVFETVAKQDIYNLSILLGLEPAALVEELSAEQEIPPVPPEIPVGLPSDLIRRRPDIRRAEAQLHGATARIGVATADLFPKFSLTGSFGYISTDLTQLVNWNSRSWSIGPSVSWPLFDAGRIRSNIQVQNALEEQALITYRKSILVALNDVESALVAYQKEQERRNLLILAVENNRKALDLAMQLYTAGQTDFLNVLTVQGTLHTSEDALVQSTRSLDTDLIALYKALGGGWEVAPY